MSTKPGVRERIIDYEGFLTYVRGLVQAFRAEHRLTQAAVARRIGLQPSFLSKLLAGKTGSIIEIGTLDKLAKLASSRDRKVFRPFLRGPSTARRYRWFQTWAANLGQLHGVGELTATWRAAHPQIIRSFSREMAAQRQPEFEVERALSTVALRWLVQRHPLVDPTWDDLPPSRQAEWLGAALKAALKEWDRPHPRDVLVARSRAADEREVIEARKVQDLVELNRHPELVVARWDPAVDGEGPCPCAGTCWCHHDEAEDLARPGSW